MVASISYFVVSVSSICWDLNSKSRVSFFDYYQQILLFDNFWSIGFWIRSSDVGRPADDKKRLNSWVGCGRKRSLNTLRMSLLDSSASLLATCAGDTVKLFDVSVKSGDPCTLSYTPSPGSQVNSVKWNHTSNSPLQRLCIYSFSKLVTLSVVRHHLGFGYISVKFFLGHI